MKRQISLVIALALSFVIMFASVALAEDEGIQPAAMAQEEGMELKIKVQTSQPTNLEFYKITPLDIDEGYRIELQLSNKYENNKLIGCAPNNICERGYRFVRAFCNNIGKPDQSCCARCGGGVHSLTIKSFPN